MLIDYQNVSIYQADKCVLKGINFHVDEGEFAYLIGKVGSGKSSLLKTLYCELDLVEGETDKAEILGRDLKTIRRKDIPALRKELGIIFQDFQLLHDRSVRKLRVRAQGYQMEKQEGQRQAHRGSAQRSRHDRENRQDASRALRWRTAACGHRPCPAQQSEDHHRR